MKNKIICVILCFFLITAIFLSNKSLAAARILTIEQVSLAKSIAGSYRDFCIFSDAFNTLFFVSCEKNSRTYISNRFLNSSKFSLYTWNGIEWVYGGESSGYDINGFTYFYNTMNIFKRCFRR